MSECAKRARKLPGLRGKGITIRAEFSEGSPWAGAIQWEWMTARYSRRNFDAQALSRQRPAMIAKMGRCPAP